MNDKIPLMQNNSLFSPFNIAVVIIHIIYAAIIILLWNRDKYLLYIANYYFCLIFQIILSIYLLYKFNPLNVNKLEKNDETIIFTAGFFLLYISLTTSIVGSFTQSIFDAISPYEMTINSCNL
jgi:membrane protease YdiL (CAAX protease family)